MSGFPVAHSLQTKNILLYRRERPHVPCSISLVAPGSQLGLPVLWYRVIPRIFPRRSSCTGWLLTLRLIRAALPAPALPPGVSRGVLWEAAASPGPALLPAQAVDQNSLEEAVESSDQGKIKHELPQKEGCLWVYSCFTVLLARCFIRASALHHWRGGCCSGKESLDLFSSAVSSQCKLEQRQVLPAERCEPNRQMSLLALEKSRTL